MKCLILETPIPRQTFIPIKKTVMKMQKLIAGYHHHECETSATQTYSRTDVVGQCKP